MPRTDHSERIDELRRQSKASGPGSLVALMNDAAAALLEVHDATGISLDDWKGPRELVEYAIGEEIQENGA